MGSLIPITRSKIIIPQKRDEWLSRPRLLEMLNRLLDNRLIIVSAPAGYGKTALLIDFIHYANWPACWFTLEALDQDLQRFVAHFIASLNFRFPAFGKISLAALESITQDNLNLDALVSLIINDIDENISEYFIIVLDDYHLVEGNKTINNFVNAFIQGIDENCHLIISSRALLTLPDLPLLVERSEVDGFGFSELAFLPNEIQQLLLKNNHLPITDAEAEEMARDSEGWITGLLLSSQLLGIDITSRLRLARNSDLGLYEYLARQVLERQPETVQRFLLYTSILEEFDASQCQEVIGTALGIEEDWSGLMQTILHHNLFILPVGEEGLSLRYHHLFRDFLQTKISRERPEEVIKIRKRLAGYFIRQGEWERAYDLYYKLENFAAIPALIEQAGSDMVLHGRLTTLAEWLERLPPATLATYPALVSLYGTVLVSRGETRRGLAFFDQAIHSLQNNYDRKQMVLTLFRRSTVHRLLGEYEQSLADAEEALSLTVAPPLLDEHLGDVLYTKGMALYYLGDVGEAQNYLEKAITAYEASGDKPTRAKALLDVGMVARTLGQYSAAEIAYTQALDYYQATGNMIIQANLCNNLGVLQHLLRNYEAALTSLEKAIHYAEIGFNPRLEAYALASIGDLYRDLEAISEASEAYQRARQVAERVLEHYLLFYLLLAESRLMRLSGDPAKAQEKLWAAQTIATEGDSYSDQNLCRLEQAGLAISTRNFQELIPSLVDAVAYFDAKGYLAESVRGHLYLAVAFFETVDKANTLVNLTRLAPLFIPTQLSNDLIVSGRELHIFLKDIQADKDFAVILSPLLQGVAYFEQHQLPTVRRLLRRKSQVVPFAPPKLTIFALGKMQVKVADNPVSNPKWRVSAARDLLYLLLSHPNGLNREQIEKILWPNSSFDEINLRFKNMVYQLRQTIGKNAILLEDEIYLFNRAIDYDYDVENYKKEIALAQKAASPDEKMAHYQTAVRLYKGTYLPQIDATWFIAERNALHQDFKTAALSLGEFFLAKGKYEKALSYGERTLKEDRSQEDAHRLLMRIHAAMGNQILVTMQYNQCCKVLKDDLNTDPTDQTQRLYYELTH